jgi:hypothetical protein
VHERGAWKLYEITRNAAGTGGDYHVLSENVLSAAVSPNGKYLIYYFDPPSDSTVKDNYLVLRDLTSNQDKQIISNVQLNWLAWATDSKTFSYESNHSVFVADLSGRSRVVYQAPHGNYKVSASVKGYDMYAPFGEPKWIAPDRFVFDRFAGELPFSQQLGGDRLSVEPNKTTIVFTSTPARLIDLNQRWVVRGSCAGQSLLLLGENSRPGQLYVTTVNDLPAGKQRALPSDINSDATADLQFIHSTCRLVYLKDEGEKGSHTQIIYIDPTTLQQTQGPNLDLHQVLATVFDPAGKYAVMIHKDGTFDWLSVVNIENGQSMHLDTYKISRSLPEWNLLGWIE